jgi:predicted ATPase/class 3 adenylate cyclase
MTGVTTEAAARLRPYVAGLAVDWLQTTPDTRHKRIEGSLAFVDISGFTTLTERLATKGKVGAEEMSDLLNASFATLLEEAYAYGAVLVKWGGDAVLLLFEGPDHAALACRAAYEMRRTMRRIGRLQTSVGIVQLKMSVGVDSGAFDFFMAGRRHRELLVAGPAATATAVMEQTAEAGEIVVGPATAAALAARCVGERKGDGFLLRSAPEVDPRCRYWPRLQEAFDFGTCLDPAIRDHLLTEVGDSEHRQIAVAFVEISGVDDLLVRQGPGAVASGLHDLITLVQGECERHHVTFWETDISKDGFKIMLVAGAPRSTGHDEDGMLRATRTILDRHSGPIKVRIGINSGRVFNGGFGPAFRRTWSVKGDAINLAARVMGKAADGQLLATETLLRRATSRLEADLLPPFMVKGKKHPVHAAVVRHVSSDRADGPSDQGPFAGRRGDVDVLLAAAAGAQGGAGSAVAVLGQPGMGKSRLVDHVCRRLGTSTTVVRSFGDVYEAATAYYTVRRLLRGSIGLGLDASDADVISRLRQVVVARAPALAPLLPLLAVPFGVTLPDTAESSAVQEQFRRPRTVSLVVELLRSTATTSTVFVVDDVHAADDASVELLDAIAAEAVSRPWLLVLAGRTLPAALAAGHPMRRLELTGMSVEDARTLVLDTPEGVRLPPHVVRAIVERGEGNPLFLRELVAAVGASESGELPGTLEELLAAQVDDLAPQPRRLLRTVSVLGTRFDESVAERLLDSPPTSEQWRALEHFLATHADGTKRFRSGLVRDAAYEGLPFRRRVDLHARAATALRERMDAGGADHTEALSLHSLAAQNYADAWHYSVAAGERARGVYANAEAITFYRRALAAARHLPDLPAVELAELLEKLGDLHYWLSELEPSAEAYRAARRQAPYTDHARRARLAIGAAMVATRAGSLARALRWYTTAERELDEGSPASSGGPGELRARIVVERALIRYYQGRYRESAALCTEALHMAEAVGADFVVARALHALDANEMELGRGSDHERVTRALELFERCGDLTRQASLWIHLGIRAYYDGAWDVAVEHYERAQHLQLRAGDEWNAATASANIAEILLDQGRIAEAEPIAVDALRVYRASGTPSYVGYGTALMGRLCARSGRFVEATALLTEAASAYMASDERFELIDVDVRAAEALVLQGAADAAIERLDRAEAALRSAVRASGADPSAGSDEEAVGSPLLATLLLRWRGYAMGQRGDVLEARELFDAALASARARGSKHDIALALDALGWLQPDEEHLAERDELFAQLGIVWAPQVPSAAVTAPAALDVIPRQQAPEPVLPTP